MKCPLACVLVAWFGVASSMAGGQVFAVGDSFVGFPALDQHRAPFTYQAGDARFILFDTPSETGPSESPKDPDWFAKNHALLIVNLSELSGFKRNVGWSRIAAKPFRLLAVEDKAAAARFPREPGKFTVLRLDNAGKIVAIRFAAPGKELKQLVEADSF